MKRTLLLCLLLFLPCLAFAVPAPPIMTYDTNGLSVTISWDEVSGATGYKLIYAPYPYAGPETIGHIDVAAQTSKSFYLWEGAAYHIAVTAYDVSGESAYSNIEYFIMGPPTAEWVDNDGDGYVEVDGDCDDTATGTYPGATEICGDGIDQDCNGSDLACPIGESSFEADIRVLINQYRSNNGRGVVSHQLVLQGLSLEHNDYMIRTGDFSHSGFGEIRAPKAFAIGCTRIVENLAWNYPTPQAAFDGWKNSSNHNVNMLDPEINFIGLSKSGAYLTMLGCKIP